MKDLEYMVLRKDRRLPVFEEIDERLTKMERARAEGESALLWEIEALKKAGRDQAFDNENKRMQIESLEGARESLLKEMARSKEAYEKSKEEYIGKMKTEHAKMLDHIDELRKRIDSLEGGLSLTSAKSLSNFNNI